MKDKLVQDIIELEWEAFTRVQNRGGKAPCQGDRKTFDIMRGSQAGCWTEALLQSYYSDLLQAKEQNRNLMTEKYARMMETTFPEEYPLFADMLPGINSETLDRIEQIVTIHLRWAEDLSISYPRLFSRARAIYTEDDSAMVTSFETYLRGELKTYSSETVRLYGTMTREYLSGGENLEEVYLLNAVRKYGYDSLGEAEKKAGSSSSLGQLQE